MVRDFYQSLFNAGDSDLSVKSLHISQRIVGRQAERTNHITGGVNLKQQAVPLRPLIDYTVDRSSYKSSCRHTALFNLYLFLLPPSLPAMSFFPILRLIALGTSSRPL